MKRPAYFILLFFTFIFNIPDFHSQNTNISGIINIYTPVISFPTGNCIDSFSVASTTGFNVGDSVLIIEMQGAYIDTSNTITFGTILNYGNAGNYEFGKISSISGNTIILNGPLFRSYDIAGKVQLVSFPHYVDATVTATLSAQAWNGTTGGVLAFTVSGNLILNANIDLTGDGFRGGALSVNYYSVYDYNFYEPMNPGRGGQKGEGIALYLPNKGYGRGPQANGGGGGNEINAAGAGGANYGWGGHGGYAYTVAPDTIWGMRSKNLDTGIVHNKIFLGGGGGGGHQNNSDGTAGKNGGGIIFIHSNTIIGNNDSIKSNGVDQNLVATIDGAGGGGGGGSVFIQTLNFTSNLAIQVKGGKGGDEVYALQCHGNGGGGGGGVIETPLASFPGNVITYVSGGLRGNGTCYNTAGDAANGDSGRVIFNWSNPLIIVGNSQDTICSGQSIQIGTTGFTGFSYQWNNGPTTSTQSVNPNNTTTYILTISDSVCSISSANDTFIVNVIQSPVASFTFNQNCQTVNFTNNSTGGISYLWHFGDGDTSSLLNPNHSYLSSGTYLVSLIANSGVCSDTIIDTITIPPISVAAFSPVVNNCSLTVHFTNNSTGSTIYQWNFGDGNTDTIANPTHTYSNSGTYIITLITGTGACADTTIDSITVHQPAQTLFTADTLSGCSPFTVVFTSTSSNTISYLWHFGDGGTSTLANPTHIYTTSGIFSDTLIAYGSGGCNDTVIHQNYINVIAPPIVTSAFIADTLSHCDSVTIHFTNNSTNATSYFWNFGDGNTSILTNPTHTYTSSGNFTVILIAYNASVCGTISDTVTHILNIVVYQSAIAAFPDTSYTACGNLTVLFENNSSNAISYLWYFGDGNTSTSANPTHNYYTAGIYTVTLIAYGAGGCNDTIIHQNYITILNIDSVSSSFFADTTGCIPFTVPFTNTGSNGTSWLWNFGDGGTSTSFSTVHTYVTAGTYTVSLITYRNSPCGPLSDTAVQVAYIVVDSPMVPKSSFSAQSIIGCSPVTVSFSNTSSNGASFLWNFGDGQFDTTKNPTHTFYYGTSGTFTITLVTYAKPSKCNNAPDTMVLTDYITVDTCNLYIPNVFSPNGDGKNDFFDVVAEGYTLYHLVIYDRWGLKMFESNDKNVLWNGKVNNTEGDAPDGTYYYIFSATDYNSKSYSSHGYLTLIR